VNWLQRLIKGLGRRGSNTPLSFDEWMSTPPPKTAAAINRHLDREIARRRGSNPTAPGNKPAASAEMPSDELLDHWVQEARRVHTASGYHINASTTMARLAIDWARQQQAKSLQIPPPGAEPVATDGELLEELADLWPGCMPSTVRRTIYQKGRADERTAILRELGVEP
jgi:hypothetical protein